MKRSSAGQEEQSTELNITPMIDCVFLLLIFFVVTMQVPQIERNMPANLPKIMQGKSDKQDPEELVRYFVRLEYDEGRDPGVKRRLKSAVAEFGENERLAANAGTHAEREHYEQLAQDALRAVPRPTILAQGARVRTFQALDGQLLLLGRSAKKDARIQIVLDADRVVPFMFVARIQDICSARGFKEISFAAKRED